MRLCVCWGGVVASRGDLKLLSLTLLCDFWSSVLQNRDIVFPRTGRDLSVPPTDVAHPSPPLVREHFAAAMRHPNWKWHVCPACPCPFLGALCSPRHIILTCICLFLVLPRPQVTPRGGGLRNMCCAQRRAEDSEYDTPLPCQHLLPSALQPTGGPLITPHALR